MPLREFEDDDNNARMRKLRDSIINKAFSYEQKLRCKESNGLTIDVAVDAHFPLSWTN
ncbi:hypothetical protein [[Hallella] seregens]|uniref:Uncharacterized protein n=1 Tax=Hallella seregens ATCC 51272 TaxID=1336250 RepID=A0ABV5ZKH2_9BACT|nr:hypothetical protein [Hallella seregens]